MPKAVKFIAIFLGSYLLMQLLYTGFLMLYAPGIDPLSYTTARWVIGFFPDGSMVEIPNAAKMQLLLSGKPVVNINEGCNGLSVFIALFAFLLAFGGKRNAYFIFTVSSLVVLFGSNLFRLYYLIILRSQYPQWFNLFHDYLFPTILYLVAFFIMVAWVKWAERIQKV